MNKESFKQSLIDCTRLKVMRKGEVILRWIVYVNTIEGPMSFSDITRFCCEMNGFDYDEREEYITTEEEGRFIICKNHRVIHGHLFWVQQFSNGEWGADAYGKIIGRGEGRRRYRGYYSTNLLGTMFTYGLLKLWCERIQTDEGPRWKMNNDKLTVLLDKNFKVKLYAK